MIWVGRILELVGEGTSSPARRLWLGAGVAAAIAFAGLMKVAEWQNGVRLVMEMPPLEEFRVVVVAGVALFVAVLLILLGRLFRRAWLILARLLLIVLPVRAALLAGLVVASALFWSVGSGVLVRGVVDFLDKSYAQLDALIPADTGLIVADRYGGELVRHPVEMRLAPARRKAMTLAFARLAAARLSRTIDPRLVDLI